MTVKMPEPAFRLTWREGMYWVSKPNICDTDCFTADQLEAYAAARVAEERERCARICEAEKVDAVSTHAESDYAYNAACDHCAAAIRGEK